MASWLVPLAVLAVLLPLALGVFLGHVPRGFLLRSAVPLAAAALLTALGVQTASSRLGPHARLAVSGLFGLIWAAAGLQLLRVEKRNGSGPPQAALARRGIAYTFLALGAIWVTVTIIQFFRPEIGS